MVATDEDALFCDFAETYHIYNWRALPVRVAATLAFGLHDDSRIKSIMPGYKYPLNTMLLASAVDAMNLIIWAQTEDGQNDINRPKSIAKMLLGEEEGDSNDVRGFDSPKDFEAARARIIGG